jgi:hypothetical protein
MNRRRTGLFSAHTVRRLDIALVAWLVLWLALASWMVVDIRRQTELSDNVTAVGSALSRTAQTFDTLSLLPLVGGRIGQFVGQINDTATRVERSGTDSHASIESLSVLVGVAVAVIPTILMLVLYLPFRLSWRRYVAEVRRALAASPPDPLIDAYLARRAVENLSYDRLRALGDDPWRDIEEGRVRSLADGEIERLGLRRPERG